MREARSALTFLSLLAVAGCAPEAARRPLPAFAEVLKPEATRGLRLALLIDGPNYEADKEERCARLLGEAYGVAIDARSPVRIHLRLGEPNQLTILHRHWSMYNQPREGWTMEHLCADSLATVVRLLPELDRRTAELAAAAAPAIVVPVPALTPPPPPPPAPEPEKVLVPERKPAPIEVTPEPAPAPVAGRAEPRSPPGSAAAHAALARDLYARVQLREAAAEFLVAFDLDRDPAHLLHAGYALHQLGRRQRSAADLRAARALYARFLEAEPLSSWISLFDQTAADLAELGEAP